MGAAHPILRAALHEADGIGYVYFLVAASGDAFKLGISTDPVLRAEQLPDEFDLDASVCVEVSRSRLAHIEAALHHLFSDHWIHDGPARNGHTEWFRIDALEPCLRFVRLNKEVIRCGDVVPISTIDRKAAAPASPRPTKRCVVTPDSTHRPSGLVPLEVALRNALSHQDGPPLLSPKQLAAMAPSAGADEFGVVRAAVRAGLVEPTEIGGDILRNKLATRPATSIDLLKAATSSGQRSALSLWSAIPALATTESPLMAVVLAETLRPRRFQCRFGDHKVVTLTLPISARLQSGLQVIDGFTVEHLQTHLRVSADDVPTWSVAAAFAHWAFASSVPDWGIQPPTLAHFKSAGVSVDAVLAAAGHDTYQLIARQLGDCREATFAAATPRARSKGPR
jgi:hypothetical protein